MAADEHHDDRAARFTIERLHSTRPPHHRINAECKGRRKSKAAAVSLLRPLLRLIQADVFDAGGRKIAVWYDTVPGSDLEP